MVVPSTTMTKGNGDTSRLKSLRRLYAPAGKSVSRLYGSSPHFIAMSGLIGMKPMLDVAFVILGAVLFLGALLYARACANV
jgi:hypothetical protein